MSPATPGRARWVSLGLLTATFLVGALVGVAVDRVLVGPGTVQVDRDDDRRDRDDDDDRDRDRQYVIHEVEMTADQRTAIDSILAARAQHLEERSDSARAEWFRSFRAITDSTRAAINEVLTPEQQAEYERLLEERRQRFRDRRDRDDDADGRDKR